MDIEEMQELRQTVQANIRRLEDAKGQHALSTNQQKSLDALRMQDAGLEREISTAVEKRAQTVAMVTGGSPQVISAFGAGDASHRSNGAALEARDLTERTITDPAVSEYRDLFHSEERAFTTVSSSTGSAVVPGSIVGPLAEKVRATNPIMTVAQQFSLVGGNSVMRLPVKLTHSTTTITDDFTTARDSLNTTATFAEKDLTCIDYYTHQVAERHWLQSTPGGEDLVVGWAIEDIYESFAGDIATGDGSGNANGLFTAAAVAYYNSVIYTGASGVLSAAAFVEAYTSLPPKHRAQAKWLMNGASIAAAMALDAPNSSSTVPLVTVDPQGVSRILGIEVLETTDAPALAAGSVSVALLAPEGYATGVHMAPEVNVDLLTAVPMVKFNALARLGGQYWNPEACALIVADDEPSA